MEFPFWATQNEEEEQKNDQNSFPRCSLSRRHFVARCWIDEIDEVHKDRIMIIVVDAVKELWIPKR